MNNDFCAYIWQCLERLFISSFYLWNWWFWESGCRKSMGCGANPTWIRVLFLANFMDLGKDFTFLNLFPHKIRTHSPRWEVVMFFSRPPLSLQTEMWADAKPHYCPVSHLLLTLFETAFPSVVTLLSFHTGLRLPSTPIQHSALFCLSDCQFSAHVTSTSSRYHGIISECMWSIMSWD